MAAPTCINDVMEAVERNRARLEQKVGGTFKAEPISMSHIVLLRRPDGTAHVVYWNGLSKKYAVEAIGRYGKPPADAMNSSD